MNLKKVSIWQDPKDGNFCVQREGDVEVYVFLHLPPAIRKLKDLMQEA